MVAIKTRQYFDTGFPDLGRATTTLDKLQKWLDFNIKAIDEEMMEREKGRGYSAEEYERMKGKIEAFEYVKTHIHELVSR